MGGASVGTNAFIRAFTKNALEDYKQRIMTLSCMDPQVGIGLHAAPICRIGPFLPVAGHPTPANR